MTSSVRTRCILFHQTLSNFFEAQLHENHYFHVLAAEISSHPKPLKLPLPKCGIISKEKLGHGSKQIQRSIVFPMNYIVHVPLASPTSPDTAWPAQFSPSNPLFFEQRLQPRRHQPQVMGTRRRLAAPTQHLATESTEPPWKTQKTNWSQERPEIETCVKAHQKSCFAKSGYNNGCRNDTATATKFEIMRIVG
jgi:hypothetical protein